MVSKRISELPAAGALDGTEQIPLTQDGETRRITSDTYQQAHVIDLVRDHGAPTDGSDARAEIQAALDAAKDSTDFTKVIGPPATYGLDPTDGALTIGSNTDFDLQGGTLQRVGTNITNRMLENENYGGATTDTDIAVRNMLLIGTGAEEGTDAQAACLGFYGCDGVDVVHVETQNSNGDGIQHRQCDGFRPRHVRIGDYGRNGISPTSGVRQVWHDVEVYGDPLANAVAPKKDIDVEPNSASEPVEMFLDAVRADAITFVDLTAQTAGSDFLIEAYIDNCEFPDGFPAGIRIQSSNPTVARRFYVGPNVFCGGNNGVLVDNVSSVELDSPELHAGSGHTNPNGVQLENQAHDLRLLSPKFSGSMSREILCLSGATADGLLVTDADMALARLIGSNCRFQGCDITEIEISESASTGNVFDIDSPVGTVTLLNSALKSDQTFRHEHYARGDGTLAVGDLAKIKTVAPLVLEQVPESTYRKSLPVDFLATDLEDYGVGTPSRGQFGNRVVAWDYPSGSDSRTFGSFVIPDALGGKTVQPVIRWGHEGGGSGSDSIIFEIFRGQVSLGSAVTGGTQESVTVSEGSDSIEKEVNIGATVTLTAGDTFFSQVRRRGDLAGDDFSAAVSVMALRLKAV